jgi:Tfp pilus assembly protein PilZ
MKYQAAAYILALFLVGFFLWIIRGLVRSLSRRQQLPSGLPDALRTPSPAEGAEPTDKLPVDWPFNLFFHNDDIEYPGRLEALTPAGAFLRCSAPLRIGQTVSLYIDVPDGEQCRVSARVLWVGRGQGQHPAAQVRFEGLSGKERERLSGVARQC